MQDMPKGFSTTWQDRCKLADDATHEEAEEVMRGWGYRDEDLTWNDDGSITVTNVTTGFTPPLGAALNDPFPGGHNSPDAAESAAGARTCG
jgi:hypothetical protein